MSSIPSVSNFNISLVFILAQPFQVGRSTLQGELNMPGVFCKTIQLQPSNFLSTTTSPILIFLSASWPSSRDGNGNSISEASASWSEDVRTDSFKACTLVAGRHNNNYFQLPPIMHWMVFQREFFDMNQSGSVNLNTWRTGSQCQQVTYLFQREPIQVYTSVSHSKPNSYSDAMTVWSEVQTNGYSHSVRVCARELQNFDGLHEGIVVVS